MGQCSPNRYGHRRGHHRIDIAGICPFPSPARHRELDGRHHQPPCSHRQIVPSQRLSWRPWPDRSGLSVNSIGNDLLWASARPRPALSRLRVKTPKRAIVPLSVDEVARFWSSFRNSRDLAIVGLMLLQGLRSQEVLGLRSGGFAAIGIADPCTWQRRQDSDSCHWPRRQR